MRKHLHNILALILLLGTTHVVAQEEVPTTLSDEAEQYFVALMPETDTLYNNLTKEGSKDSFGKRFSIHTNLVDWATILPNIGVEFDLNGTHRSQYSIMLVGKFNGKTANRTDGRWHYDIASVRLEGRKYWRTGKRGTETYHTEYEKLQISQKDSNTYNGNPYRSRFYNWRHKVRRNFFSGRTLDNARNWRAYYLGVWAAANKYDLKFWGDGKKGTAVGAGISGGWNIPILPQRFPKEGGLDLDLGLNVGVMANRSDAAEGQSSEWSIVKYPVLQDVHVGLVWRFRSIKRKTDLSLVDDYKKVIEEFQQRIDKQKWIEDSTANRNEFVKDSLNTRAIAMADSTEFWDFYHKRRLMNALIINPDTIFQGQDADLYLKLIKGVNTSQEVKKGKKSKKKKDKSKNAEATEQNKKSKKGGKK